MTDAFPDAANPIFHDFNHFLHELRGCEVSRMPKGAEVMVSVGCAGKWYFDWIDAEYGAVKKHTGIEYYSPKPDDLPANVVWLPQKAGNMEGVESESVDLVFSGQNIEHLWLDDLYGFLVESNRVLKHGGNLVIDSPNGEVTNEIMYRQPEHVAEYTVPQIHELLSLAGFSVSRTAGIAVVRESGDVWSDLSIAARKWSGKGGYLRKAMLAASSPRNSFIWWIEAKKAAAIQDKAALREACERMIDANIRERTRRSLTQGSITSYDGHRFAVIESGNAGFLAFGPYIPLQAGKYIMKMSLNSMQAAALSSNALVAVADVAVGEQILVAMEIPASLFLDGLCLIRLPFELADTVFGLEARIRSSGLTTLSTPLDLHIARQ